MGTNPCLLKSSQGDPEVQPDLGTQGLSDLPRVLKKVRKHTQAINLFFVHPPTYLLSIYIMTSILLNTGNASEKTVVIPLAS